jgi:hypothetical protein
MSGDGEINRRPMFWWLRAGLTLVVVAGLAIDSLTWTWLPTTTA